MGKNKNKNKGNGGVQATSTPAVATPTTLTIVVDSEVEKEQLQEYIAMADQYSLSKHEEADQYYATKKEEADALRGQAEAEIERRVSEAIAQERKRMKQEIADAEAEAKEIIKKASKAKDFRNKQISKKSIQRETNSTTTKEANPVTKELLNKMIKKKYSPWTKIKNFFKELPSNLIGIFLLKHFSIFIRSQTGFFFKNSTKMLLTAITTVCSNIT